MENGRKEAGGLPEPPSLTLKPLSKVVGACEHPLSGDEGFLTALLGIQEDACLPRPCVLTLSVVGLSQPEPCISGAEASQLNSGSIHLFPICLPIFPS